MLTQKEKKHIILLKKQYSIYAPWTEGRLFRKIIDSLSEPFEKLRINTVVGIEARGFILGAPVAYILHAGFVAVRKAGNMYKKYSPYDVHKEELTDYSGQRKTLELANSEKGIQREDNVVIIDDWFETGAQGKAAVRLVEKAGGTVVGIGIMIDNMTDKVSTMFTPYNLNSLVYEKPERKEHALSSH